MGLKSYRQAALDSPASKRLQAFKEVLLVEQMQRMLRSNASILEFEDLRFKLVGMTDREEQRRLLNRMESILVEKLNRTEAALEATLRDSRLGYEMEMDYVYAPHVLRAKLEVLHRTLEKELPSYRREKGL